MADNFDCIDRVARAPLSQFGEFCAFPPRWARRGFRDGAAGTGPWRDEEWASTPRPTGADPTVPGPALSSDAYEALNAAADDMSGLLKSREHLVSSPRVAAFLGGRR
jgi:hypothetical protein